ANQYFNLDSDEFIKYDAAQENFTTEITPFSLGYTYPLITRDRNLALRESKTSGIPITLVDIEFDTEYYVTGRKMNKNHPYLGDWVKLIKKLKVNSNLDRVLLSSNAPYHMSISDWPIHIHNLIKPQNDISLLDISALLSFNPARILNLSSKKGYLGAGADADIICFQANPEKFTEKTFSNTKFVIKSGHLIKKNSEYVVSTGSKRNIYWSEGEFDANERNKTKKRLENFYDKRFSMHLSALENKEIPQMQKL
ncbi:MAG: hypothetical protein EU530_10810, partial [Promethearchaeota archaeon]